jgi:butyryl-CoA dehydrogenase
MNFVVGAEEAAFGESVRAALEGYQPDSWEPGTALDDREPALARRLDELGLAEAAEAGHGFVSAAGLELGRALAPLAVFDELAVGEHALAASGLARYARGRSSALDLRDEGAFLVPLAEGLQPEPALDGQGFARLAEAGEEVAFPDLAAWAAFHVAYLGGLAGAALSLAVEHARSRHQFGKPLLALAPVQQSLADAASLARGAELLAWQEHEDVWPALAYAGEAACRVCEIAHQVHGAIGFSLEGPVHSFFRRAQATRVFTAAVARAARSVASQEVAQAGSRGQVR